MRNVVKRRPAVLLLAALLTTQANGAFVTGTVLLERLKGDVAEKNNAIGYIVAIADEGEDKSRPQPRGTCFSIPNGVPSGELAERVRKFLDRNPAIRGDVASNLVKASLSEAFPCRK